jgi:uncharacterized protein
MRIAVIGSGISGNVAAWALHTSTAHDITVYEKNNRIGGHSATVDIDYDGLPLCVDTGFIVYNELNYPLMTQLFAHLSVETMVSDMSFSVSAEGGKHEWSGKTERILDGLFARRRNIISPKHWGMLKDMLRFNKQALQDRALGLLEGFTLEDYLRKGKYSDRFRDHYLIPMGGAIWSMSPQKMLNFPADSFVAFFDNHRLLHWSRPTWRTVVDGSRQYVQKLTAPFAHKIKLGCGAVKIFRDETGVEILDTQGGRTRFDQVVIATHSDEALALLDQPSRIEREILRPIAYSPNSVWLHRDPQLMPRRKAAWAAWNVLENGGDQLSVTYWMNILQPFLGKENPLFVSLNPAIPPRADLVFGHYTYEHPQYDKPALAAQKLVPHLQGQQHTWYCGAWQGYGFHEDGVRSGFHVAQALGAQLPWLHQAQAAQARG